MQQPVRCAQYFHNQAQVWSEKFNNASGSGRKIYCKQMLDEAIENDVQFQNVLRHYQKHGLGLVLRSWKNWGVVLRDPDHPTFYRFQIFNETGLVAHYVRN